MRNKKPFLKKKKKKKKANIIVELGTLNREEKKKNKIK